MYRPQESLSLGDIFFKIITDPKHLTPLGILWPHITTFPVYTPLNILDRRVQNSCFYAKKILTELVYDTIALEGNPLTFTEVQTLLDDITVGGHRLQDEHQVLHQASAWKSLIEKVEKKEFVVNKETFCQLHSLVAQEEALAWGEFRTGPVRIAGTSHRPPEASQLDEIFTEGMEFLQNVAHPVEKAILFFLFGAFNQFFWDGNQRTSRLFMNGILMSAGYHAISVPARDRQLYHTLMVNFYDSKDGADVASYLLGLLTVA